MIGGRVLAPDALADAAAGKTVYTRVLVQVAVQEGVVLSAPAGALAEAWAHTGVADQPFLDLLTGRSVVVSDALAGDDAAAVGELAARGGDRHRIGMAHAVQVALARGWPLVTGEAGTAAAMSDAVEIEELP